MQLLWELKLKRYDEDLTSDILALQLIVIPQRDANPKRLEEDKSLMVEVESLWSHKEMRNLRKKTPYMDAAQKETH